MTDTLVQMFDDYGFRRLFPFVILVALRPAGLMFGFMTFSWALGPARVIRFAMAISIGALPFMANIEIMNTFVLQSTSVTLAFEAPKEFFIGYAIGFLASVPFFALQWAGALTDQYRGENDSGINSPLGGTLSTFGLLYYIIGVFAFFSFDGLWLMVDNLYQSYTIWQIGSTFPTLTPQAVGQLMSVLGNALVSAIRIALPLLCLLVVLEFAVAVGGRVSRKFNFGENGFMFKNLAVIGTLPVLVWFVWLLVAEISTESAVTFNILRLVFK